MPAQKVKKPIKKTTDVQGKKQVPKAMRKAVKPKPPRNRFKSTRSLEVRELRSEGVPNKATLQLVSKKGLDVAATPPSSLEFDAQLAPVIAFMQLCVAQIDADIPSLFLDPNAQGVMSPVELTAYFVSAWLQAGIDAGCVSGTPGTVNLSPGSFFKSNYKVPTSVAKFIEYYWRANMPYANKKYVYPAGDIPLGSNTFLSGTGTTLDICTLQFPTTGTIYGSAKGFSVFNRVQSGTITDLVLGPTAASSITTLSQFAASTRPNAINVLMNSADSTNVNFVLYERISTEAPDYSAFAFPTYCYTDISGGLPAYNSQQNYVAQADAASTWSANISQFDPNLAIFMSCGNWVDGTSGAANGQWIEGHYDGRFNFVKCAPHCTMAIGQNATQAFGQTYVGCSAWLEYAQKFIWVCNRNTYRPGSITRGTSQCYLGKIPVTDLSMINAYNPNFNDFLRIVSAVLNQMNSEKLSTFTNVLLAVSQATTPSDPGQNGYIQAPMIIGAISAWLGRIFKTGVIDRVQCCNNFNAGSKLMSYQNFVPPASVQSAKFPHLIAEYIEDIGIISNKGFIYVPQPNFNQDGLYQTATDYQVLAIPLTTPANLANSFNVGTAVPSGPAQRITNMAFPANQFGAINNTVTGGYSPGQQYFIGSSALDNFLNALVIPNPMTTVTQAYLATCAALQVGATSNQATICVPFSGSDECLDLWQDALTVCNTNSISGSAASTVCDEIVGAVVEAGVSTEFYPVVKQQNIAVSNTIDALYFFNSSKQVAVNMPSVCDEVIAGMSSVFRMRTRNSNDTVGATGSTGGYIYPSAFTLSNLNSISNIPTRDFVTAASATGEITKQYLNDESKLHNNIAQYKGGKSLVSGKAPNCRLRGFLITAARIGSTILKSQTFKGVSALACSGVGSVIPGFGPACMAVTPFVLKSTTAVIDKLTDKAERKRIEKQKV